MAKRFTPSAALALILLGALLAAGDAAAPRVGRPAADESFKEVNAAARAAYRRAREESLARSGPVVLFDGDELVLRYGLQRLSARFAPEKHHDLKTISHVPLGLHALLVHRVGRPLADDRLFDLRCYRALVLAVEKALPERGLGRATLARQQQIVAASLKLLERALDRQRIERKELVAFARGVRPLLEASAVEAARGEIDALHRQMTTWRARLTEKEWKRLTVIVMGSQMPRKDNLAVQYFARLLGEKGEGKRIVYAEAIFDETKALALLGTRLLDTRIGEDFFDDPLRMHRDLLGDAGKVHLDELFAK